MTLHQITNMEADNVIKFRCLSCFCCDVLFPKGYCECLDAKNHLLVQNKESEKENNDNRNKANRVIKRPRNISEISGMTDSEQEQEENMTKIRKISRTGDKTKNIIRCKIYTRKSCILWPSFWEWSTEAKKNGQIRYITFIT